MLRGALLGVELRLDTESIGILTKEEAADGFVLACKTHLTTADLEIEIPKQLSAEDGKFTDSSSDMHLIGKELLPQSALANSLYTKARATVLRWVRGPNA